MKCLGLIGVGLVWAIALAAPARAYVDGSNDACVDFTVSILQLGDPDYSDGIIDVSNEGWVWVNKSQAGVPRLNQVSGLVLKSNVATSDNAQDHDSHDKVAHVLVDPGFEGILSNVNEPNDEHDEFVDLSELLPATQIELEWEVGTYPGEVNSSVPERFHPRWAWPNVFDRVWADGHVIFDCGHAKQRILGYVDNPAGGPPIPVKDAYYRSEIHPPRAIASMRNQALTLPGTGTTPVPVTATDLYIHGLAGAVTDVLECGMEELVEPGDGTCRYQHPNHRGTPIDVNFDFDVCLPRRPAGARLSWVVEPGPGNTIPETYDPRITEVAAPPACSNAAEPMDGQTALHVHVPLEGSGVSPAEVYARKIVAGWVSPPSVPLQHLSVRLDRMDLHITEDPSLLCSDDSELTFMWANLAPAPETEWIRLADYAPVFSNGHSKMNDYGASLFGHSYMDFTGAAWNFYIRSGRDFFLTAHGYDQDCIDDHFGYHRFDRLAPQLTCKEIFAPCETLNNDSVENLEALFSAPGYGIDPATGHAQRVVGTPTHHICFPLTDDCIDVSQYEFTVSLDRVPLTDEDTADLQVAKSCVPDSGSSFVCDIALLNPGPGLPRNVVVTDTLVSDAPAGSFTVDTPTFTTDGDPTTAADCTLTGPATFTCAIGTVPVGGRVDVRLRVATTKPGGFDNTVTASADSADPNPANNSATAGLTIVEIDVTPTRTPNPVNVSRNGVIGVGIPTTPTFDATAIDPASVCFGSASTLGARSCNETHDTGHLSDLDHDKDTDLLLHYEVATTGIAAGDTQACLSGKLQTGRTIMGCDAIVTR